MWKWPQMCCGYYFYNYFFIFAPENYCTISLDPHRAYEEEVALSTVEVIADPPCTVLNDWLQNCSPLFMNCLTVLCCWMCRARGHDPHYKMQQRVCREEDFRSLKLNYNTFLSFFCFYSSPVTCCEVLHCLCHCSADSVEICLPVLPLVPIHYVIT